MEQAIAKLTREIYLTHKLLLILAIAVFSFAVIAFIYTLIRWKRAHVRERVVLVGGLILLILTGPFVVPIEKDFEADRALADQGEFMVFEGEMIGFNSGHNSRGIQYYSGPILKNSDSGETMVFTISDAQERMKIGETYKVVYFPNTGYAEIVEGE